jgi:hypothetical protein
MENKTGYVATILEGGPNRALLKFKKKKNLKFIFIYIFRFVLIYDVKNKKNLKKYYFNIYFKKIRINNPKHPY